MTDHPDAARAAEQGGPPPTPPPSDRDRLVSDDRASQLRDRFDELQTRFVEEPEQALHRADELTADVVTEIHQALDARRAEIRGRWRRDDDTAISTEQLRTTLQRYRELLDELLRVG